MTFQCRQCGSCCMYLGDYIVIERQIAPFAFECCSVSTGTPFTAEVDGDKRHLFSDHSWIDAHPAACRFLRPDGDLIRCTIHRDSPAQCKFYRCIVMRVLGRTGEPAGTITGTLALHSQDPVLRAAYKEAMREIRDTDPDAEERLAEFLRNRGFGIQ
jgi:Fe-S-cluster containining protein